MTKRLNTVVLIIIAFTFLAGSISGVLFYARNNSLLNNSLNNVHNSDVVVFKERLQSKIDIMISAKILLESDKGKSIPELLRLKMGDITDMWLVDREGKTIETYTGSKESVIQVFDVPASHMSFRTSADFLFLFVPVYDKKAFLIGRTSINNLLLCPSKYPPVKKSVILSEYDVVLMSNSDNYLGNMSFEEIDKYVYKDTTLAFSPEGPKVIYVSLFERSDIISICLVGVIPFILLYILFSLSVLLPVFSLRRFLKKDFNFIGDMIKNFYSIGRVPQEAFLRDHCQEVKDLGKLFLKLSEKITGDITSLEKQTEKDKLTGLANRIAMEEQARKRVEEGMAFSLLFCDLDGFKPINDALGHDVGDLVLQLVASTLIETFRDKDIISRWGGDEFVVLLPGDTGDFRNRLIERARDRIAALNIASLVDTESEKKQASQFHVGISVGFSTYLDDGTTTEELIQIADERMYEDKAQRKASGIAPSR